jgi:putative membrane protein
VPYLAHLPLIVIVLGVLWLLQMILIPVYRWVFGSGAERAGISVGVLLQALLVATVLITGTDLGTAAITVLLIPVFGFLIEFVGSRTGFPFGDYHYTDVLRPQIGHVPVIIPLAWLMMLPPAWAVATRIVGTEAAVWLHALVAGLAFAAWDLFLDPQMVKWDFWRWNRTGRYFGIPLINFFGWFVSAFFITLVAHLLVPGVVRTPGAVLILVYGLTWVLETIAQLVFWDLKGPGVIGALVMGAVALSAFL